MAQSERDERIAVLRRSLTEAETSLASAEESIADVTRLEKLQREAERQLRSRHGEAQRSLDQLRTRVRAAMSLLSLDTRTATTAAADILQAASSGSVRPLGEVLDLPEEERRESLRALVQTEPDFGRWSSVYATLLSDRPAGGSPSGILVVNDTRTQNNVGCRSTTEGLLRIIEDAGLEVSGRITLAELGLLASELWVRSGSRASVDNLAVMVDVLSTDGGFEPLRRLVARSTSVVINGEGSIYDRQPKGLILLAFAKMCTERLDRPVVLVNHSAELADPVMERWAEQTFPTLDANVFRDPISLDRLPDAARSSRDCWVPDAAFTTQALGPEQEPMLRELALGQDSVLGRAIPERFVAVSGSSSLFRRDRPGDDPGIAVADLCRRLQSMGHDVVLVESDNRDRVLLRPLALELGLPYVSAANPVATFQRIFQRATCFISGRWHASIIGAVEGCPPILGDANFFKTEALHDMLELEWSMFDYDELADQADAVVAAVAAISSERQLLGERLSERARALAEQSRRGLTDTIIQVASKTPR